MPQAVILGTGAALPAPEQENTYWLLLGDRTSFLVDCAGSPIQRLQRADQNPATLTGLILTHHHPDHIYGVPILLLGMWLLRRSLPLDIYAPSKTLSIVRETIRLLEWEQWPARFPLRTHEIPLIVGAQVLDNTDFTIMSVPVCHLVPTIGLRIRAKTTGRVLAYPSDTEPCEIVKRLASNADLLLHESTGEEPGHSSAAQAGEIAEQCHVRHLILVHYAAIDDHTARLTAAASAHFRGKITLAREFDVFEF
ncbi:MAG TPA: MBL fold metallo-hydrolase [Anaerolineae bacterium]|nr:MBL fold metallo-hydrolase [Anaerolineae bacterium]